MASGTDSLAIPEFRTHAALTDRFYTFGTMKIKSPRVWGIAVFVLAVVLLAGVVYAIAGSRQNLIDYPSAFALLGRIGWASGVVAVAGLIVWILAIRARSGGAGFAATATLGMVAMAGCMYFYQSPPPPEPFMNDISTDLDDPPEFIAVLPLRPAGSNPAEYGGPEVAANQRRAHPEVQPLFSTLAPDAAFDRALEVAEDLGWDIVARDRAAGRIEAVDTTPFFRFKDDVVIRIRPNEGGSRIDLRSHSRIGLTDLGKNASRIMTFTRAYPLRG